MFSQARKWGRQECLVHSKHDVAGLEHRAHLRYISAAVAQLCRLIRSRRDAVSKPGRSQILSEPLRKSSSYVKAPPSNLPAIDHVSLTTAPHSLSSSRPEGRAAAAGLKWLNTMRRGFPEASLVHSHTSKISLRMSHHEISL